MYSREWSDCIRMNGVHEWGIRLWLPSEYVNGQKEPSCCGKTVNEEETTMGPQMITHTHIFGTLELISQLHRAFWQELFCVIGCLHKVLSVNAPITHTLIVWELILQLHAHLLHKNCFRIVCVIISGHSSEPFAHERRKVNGGHWGGEFHGRASKGWSHQPQMSTLSLEPRDHVELYPGAQPWESVIVQCDRTEA